MARNNEELCTAVYHFTVGRMRHGAHNQLQRRDQEPAASFAMPPVSIGVVDNRPYVVDGGAPPTYVGTIRSLAGVPYYMKTASGKPLAEVLQSMIVRSLNAKGYKVEDKVKIPVGTPKRESIKILSATGKESFLLTLKEWKHHIYINPFFEYEAKMSVISPSGDVLASTTQKGMIEIGKKMCSLGTQCPLPSTNYLMTKK